MNPKAREDLEKVKALIIKYQRTLDDIINILMDDCVDAETGEALCLYIAGMSAGVRQCPLTDHDFMRPLAIAWQLGACEEQEKP